jgi:hypothetical protein
MEKPVKFAFRRQNPVGSGVVALLPGRAPAIVRKSLFFMILSFLTELLTFADGFVDRAFGGVL